MLEGGLFALPPGVDFADAFVRGLRARMGDAPPEALARVTVYLNSGRTLTAVREAFDRHGATLLPRLRLLAEMGAPGAALASPLARQLELGQLLQALLAREPDLAAGQSIPQLAQSLAELMAEMQTEGRGPAALDAVDVGDHAAHWGRARRFLTIAADYYLTEPRADREARQRAAAEAALADWPNGRNLPEGPVVIAGSTGSHGATRLFMQAVAALPQGAVVLPGYDFDQPRAIWDALDDRAQDHPQHRFAALMQAVNQDPKTMRRWADTPAPRPDFNRLMSLALRPAPVTDQWIDEGPRLASLPATTAHVTLIEAESPGAEAEAIALLIRDCVGRAQPVTLVAADAMLMRRVNAALDRWRLIPDESAGQPLALTPPGLLLRHIAALFGQPLSVDLVLALMKHPLTSTGGGRGDHLRFARDLELHLRRHGPAFPDGETLRGWAAKAGGEQRAAWAEWAAQWIDLAVSFSEDRGPRGLADRIADNLRFAELLCDGWMPEHASELWQKEAGGKARATIDHLRDHADIAYPMVPRDYADLLASQLGAQAVRADAVAHPLIRIRGPREARTEATRDDGGVTILAGLNEGGWPGALSPDAWMSRQMRLDAGLTLPERRIGLAAHDFQQGAGAQTLILTRARRDADAETIPSRWLNRMLNLMRGLAVRNGPQAVAEMQERGEFWLAAARELAQPQGRTPAAIRPAPIPPAPALSKLSVTEISRLIRDPYAIYARRVLGLQALNPLRAQADPALRGQVLHQIVESFLRPPPEADTPPQALRSRFLATTARVLADEVPWPTARAFWQARMESLADTLVADELDRAAEGRPAVIEREGSTPLGATGVTLVAKPDRIDALHDGSVHIYDYKSGSVPSQKQMEAFDKQLLLEAAMVGRGAFDALPPAPVAGLSYIRLSGEGGTEPRAIPEDEPGKTWDGAVALVGRYQSGARGFAARLAMPELKTPSDYDHLSRFGEWSLADDPNPEEVGQ